MAGLNIYRGGTGPIGDQNPGGRPGTGSNPLGPRGSGPLGVHLSVHWKGRQGSYEGDGGGINSPRRPLVRLVPMAEWGRELGKEKLDRV